MLNITEMTKDTAIVAIEDK